MHKPSAARVFALLALAALAVPALAPAPALASSHNEAPFTSKNPALDDTDFYMFRDPNDPSMVNLIACRYGLIEPQGGPNYAGFQDGAWYDIKIDNNGDGVEDVTFRFTFKTHVQQPELVPLRAAGPHVHHGLEPLRQADVQPRQDHGTRGRARRPARSRTSSSTSPSSRRTSARRRSRTT